MTARLDVTRKTTEQNRVVRTIKSEAEVTNNKKLCSRYCTIEANYSQTQNTRGLFAIAELLVPHPVDVKRVCVQNVYDNFCKR